MIFPLFLASLSTIIKLINDLCVYDIASYGRWKNALRCRYIRNAARQ